MDVLPSITNEQGWGGEAAFRELCAVPKLPRGKPVSSTVAGGLLTSPSTGEAGTSCHRMAKENSRTLSTACRYEERGAAVMEDLGIGSRQWWTLWDHHPQPALHPSAWKTCLQEWSVKENIRRSNQTSLKQREEKRKSESQREDGEDQVLSYKWISLKLLKTIIKARNNTALDIMKESQVTRPADWSLFSLAGLLQ